MPAQTVIKLRRGTAAQWTSANPVLAAGEMGVETDTNKSKYGNGSTAWTSLPYSVASASGSATVEWTDVLNKPSTFTPSSHTHAIADVTNLQTSLDGKQAIVSGISDTEIGYLEGVTSLIQAQINGKAATSHSHAISDVTSLQTALDGKAATSHTHAISDTTGLQTALDGKAATSHSHAISDTTGLQTALDGKAATSHTHVKANITDFAHTHAISDTTGLQTALDGKLSATVSSPSSGQVISYNGSAWVNSAAPSGGNGGMTLISDTTLAAGANTVTLSSIPQTYKKLELEINQTGGVAAPSTASMVFNGQTNSVYSWGHVNAFTSQGTGSVTPSWSYGTNQSAGVNLPGTTNGSTSVTIPNYTSTTVSKNFQYSNYTGYIQSSPNVGSGSWHHFQHALNGITSIGFTFSAVTGSTVYRVKLWGVN